MGQFKPHRKTSLPGVLTEGESHFVSTGGGTSYVQYVINNSGQAIPPATLAHSHAISDVTGLQAALDAKTSGPGTSGTIPQYTGSLTFGNSILTVSGVRVSAAGEFVSDMPSETSITRGLIFRTSGKTRFSLGKFGADPDNGTNTGSNFEIWRYSDAGALLSAALSINRATGNTTFSGTITASGGNSTTWNAAVPGTRTITINGTTFDLTANRSWTIATGGIPVSMTDKFLAKYDAVSNSFVNSSVDDSTATLKIGKHLAIRQDGSNRSFEFSSGPTASDFTFRNTDGSRAYQFSHGSDGTLTLTGAVNMMRFNTDGTPEFLKPTGVVPFIVNTSTVIPNLNADMVDGLHASSLVQTSRTLTINGTTFDLSANRSWTIPAGVAGNGTANRFALWIDGVTIASSNLFYNGGNVGIGMVPGYQFDVSGSIRYSNQLASTVATGSAPMTVVSTTRVDNLNADMVDGIHASSFVQTSRTLTINGTTFDLSANRSWTISGGGSSTLAGLSDVGLSSLSNWQSLVYYNGQWTNINLNSVDSAYVDQQDNNVKSWASSQFVPLSRTITINGTTFDLSSNRSWTISAGITGSGSTNMFTKWTSTGNVSYAEMYEVSSAIYIGSVGTRRDLVVQGSIVPKQMTASERSSYAPGFIGAIVYQTDGTPGWYGAKDNGSGGHTWVFIA